MTTPAPVVHVVHVGNSLDVLAVPGDPDALFTLPASA